MEQRGYWDVVVAVLSFNVLVQGQERRGREEARMCKEKQCRERMILIISFADGHMAFVPCGLGSVICLETCK